MPMTREAKTAQAEENPKSLKALNHLIAQSAPLVPGADHAVLGEGPLGAGIAFVGEQPGDQEDREGRPFVGPAGQLLNQAMEEAGIDRKSVYVTNAVKHFKFEQRGKKRIHQKPTMGEVKRYRWWLMRELDFVAPKLVVALGATAAAALAGKAVAVTKARGPRRFRRPARLHHGASIVSAAHPGRGGEARGIPGLRRRFEADPPDLGVVDGSAALILRHAIPSSGGCRVAAARASGGGLLLRDPAA